jgi:hypothetical protein
MHRKSRNRKNFEARNAKANNVNLWIKRAVQCLIVEASAVPAVQSRYMQCDVLQNHVLYSREEEIFSDIPIDRDETKRLAMLLGIITRCPKEAARKPRRAQEKSKRPIMHAALWKMPSLSLCRGNIRGCRRGS